MDRAISLTIFYILTSSLLSACGNLSSLLFHPSQEYFSTPQADTYQEITLETEDGERLVNWFIPSSTPSKGIILFLHGNAQNISTHYHSVRWLPSKGYSLFLLDYRGFGLSTGTPNLPGAFKDIKAAHKWLSENYPEQRLILLGQSMGAAFSIAYGAIYDKKLTPFTHVIAEAAPESWPGIASEVMRRHWLTYSFSLPAKLIDDSFDPIDHIQKLDAESLMLIYSPDDQVIPYAHGQRLQELVDGKAHWLQTSGPHISAFAKEEYRKAVIDFLESQ